MTKPWGPAWSALLRSLWWIILLAWLVWRAGWSAVPYELLAGVWGFTVAYVGGTMGARRR